jgi:hypothetical protein
VIRLLRRFGRFWLDFVVGDDWRIAAGVAVVVACAALAARSHVAGAHVIAVCTALAVFAIAALGLALEAGAARRDRLDNTDAAPPRAAPPLHGEHAGDGLG